MVDEVKPICLPPEYHGRRQRELDDALDVICRTYDTPDPSDPFNPLAGAGDREPGYMFIGTRAGTFHKINEDEAYRVLDALLAGDSEAVPQFLDDTVWPGCRV